MTRFDNIGLAKQGQAIANNFGVMYGDGFMDKNYEIYALITHNCTKNRKKMKQYKHDLETCSTEKSGCRKKFKLNITELGDEVNTESVENWLTKKSEFNITELGDEVKPESIW
ncbi:Protein CBG26180 [Caenorhabditis briggsae]|uniref:Protein CBG26180 n=1 Tax=Caenorhabditis briggsae TaxID=6238 RepID=B6ILB6_CAEBR|nr:Protein CBG26180 [Caenorhabditis briggsae]CAS00696.1 Protein CBG26180 [Caenorhabditis briggsae]